MASLYVKDPEANELAERLARARGLSKTAAVKLALQHELDRETPAPRQQSTREWLNEYRKTHPLPPPTGLKADKAFFDEMSGDL